MVSRETTRPLRKLVPAVALGVSALLGIVGCSAGQVAQTADMEPAVDGNQGQVGTLLLRNVLVAYPAEGKPYRAGDDAPLELTIANTGTVDDELVGVTTPAGRVEITGTAKIPGQSAIEVVAPSGNPAASSSEKTTTGTSAPETTGSATTGTESPSVTETTTTVEVPPDVVGTISVVITGLTGDLPLGKNVPVTFEFRHAGSVTVLLPVGAPSTPRADNRDESVAATTAGQ